MEKTDRVCGMELEGCDVSHNFKGETYCFCSEDCKDQFEKSPEQFLK